MSSATIHIRFSQPGWHFWPGAPKHRAYLGVEHRHLFNVEVSMAVTHDDREIEFHDVRDVAAAGFAELGTNGHMGGKSCEHMARLLGAKLASTYDRRVTVTVWEDDEFGATVEAAPNA